MITPAPAAGLVMLLASGVAIVGARSGDATGDMGPCRATPMRPQPDSTAPRLVRTDTSLVVMLPAAMQQALRDSFPRFHPLGPTDFPDSVRARYRGRRSESPAAVIGDFDGDGLRDIALDGLDSLPALRGAPPSRQLVAILSHRGRPRAEVVIGGGGNGTWLRVLRGCTYRSDFRPDAIAIYSPERNWGDVEPRWVMGLWRGWFRILNEPGD